VGYVGLAMPPRRGHFARALIAVDLLRSRYRDQFRSTAFAAPLPVIWFQRMYASGQRTVARLG
jgi:hypothetical protein